MDDEEFLDRHQREGYAAFPAAIQTPSGGTLVSAGMMLRDWFAGQALAGLCAHRDSVVNPYEVWAAMAYSYADAMLKARASAEEGA